MNACINLHKTFGDRYRTGWDPCRVPPSRDPWLMTLPGVYGTIYPFGGDRLAVEIMGQDQDHLRLARQVADLPGARMEQDGDDEWGISFPAGTFDAVAELVRPYRAKPVREAGPAQRAA